MYWIMGIFKKIKLVDTLKNVGLGITDALGVSSVLKANLDSEHLTDENGRKFGKGKINFTRLIVAICTIITFILFALGKIDESKLNKIFKLLF
jgi:hypothetical protein